MNLSRNNSVLGVQSREASSGGSTGSWAGGNRSLRAQLGVASKDTAFANERHLQWQPLLQRMPWGLMSVSVPSLDLEAEAYCSGFPAAPPFLRSGDGAYMGWAASWQS